MLRRKKKYAFTLLEMLMAMSLLSFILLALVTMLGQTQKAMTTGSNKMDACERGRMALDLMDTDLSSIDFKTFYDEGLSGSAFTNNSSGFTVYVTRPGSVSQFSKVEYFLDGTNLKVSIEKIGGTGSDSTEKILLEGVESFKVTAFDADGGTSSADDQLARVTLELELMDQEMITIGKGIAGFTDGKEGGTLNTNKIKKACGGSDLYTARLKKFSRTVFINHSGALL